MTLGRKMMTAAAAALAAAAMTGSGLAQDSKAKDAKAPVIYSAEENLCRAACGDAWIEALSCADEAPACRSRADKSYKQCLPDCAAGKAPSSAAFAWRPPAKPAQSTVGMTSPSTPKPPGDGPDSTVEAPWVDARAQWKALPAYTSIPLPHAFTLHPPAYSYAGITTDIRPFVMKSPGLIKVELVVAAGQAGLALATPDGSALVSKEAALRPSPDVQAAYFEIGPQTPPVALLLRNYDPNGAPGSVTVRSVTFARAAILPPGEAERLGALK